MSDPRLLSAEQLQRAWLAIPALAPVKSIRDHIAALTEKLATLRTEAAKLGHEPGCAKYDYHGEDCRHCKIGKVHARNSECSVIGSVHEWALTPAKECDCAQSRIQEGKQDA